MNDPIAQILRPELDFLSPELAVLDQTSKMRAADPNIGRLPVVWPHTSIQGSSNTDADLMRALAAGDMRALGELVQRHQQTIRAIAYRMTGRWEVADDVTQETFLRLHRSASRYQPTAAFRTWLFRIVTNLCLDRARAPRLAALPEDRELSSNVSPDRPLVQQEKTEAIRQAIASLPERQRLAVVLHRFEQMTHDEIAQTTGWSRSAIESLLVRAYDQLRQKLKEWQDG